MARARLARQTLIHSMAQPKIPIIMQDVFDWYSRHFCVTKQHRDK
jgi:hypothetical protein